MKSLLNSLFVAFAVCLMTFISVNDAAAQNRLIDSETLSERSRIITNLQRASVDNTFGTVDYSQTELATYDDGSQATLTPILTKDVNVVRYQVAVLGAKGSILQTFVAEIAPDVTRVSLDGSYNGDLSFYTTTGDRIYGGAYVNGTQVQAFPTASFETAKTDWKCVANCLKDLYTSSLGSWCKKQCQKCFSKPKFWTCAKCAACIVGGVVYCVIKC